MAHLVDIGAFTVGQGQRPFLIAGPCVIESEQLVLETAGRIAEITRALGMPYVFKSSFDKANRTSITSFRGPGLAQGLEVLAKVKREVGVPVLTDVHTEAQAAEAGRVVDVLQIPAFLCRQTDLLIAAERAADHAFHRQPQAFLQQQSRSASSDQLMVRQARALPLGPIQQPLLAVIVRHQRDTLARGQRGGNEVDPVHVHPCSAGKFCRP